MEPKDTKQLLSAIEALTNALNEFNGALSSMETSMAEALKKALTEGMETSTEAFTSKMETIARMTKVNSLIINDVFQRLENLERSSSLMERTKALLQPWSSLPKLKPLIETLVSRMEKVGGPRFERMTLFMATMSFLCSGVGLFEGFFSLRQIKRSKEGVIFEDLRAFKDLYAKDMKTRAEWRNEKIQGSFIQLPCPNRKPLPPSRKAYLSDGMSPILTDFMRHVKEGGSSHP